MSQINNQKKESKIFFYLQVLLDVLVILLGYYITLKFRFTTEVEINKQFPIFYDIFPYIIITSLIFIYVYETFKTGDKQYIETMYSVFILLIFVQISTMAISFFTREFGFARSIFFISFIVQFFIFAVYKYIVYKLYWKFYKKKKIMIICNNANNIKISDKIKGDDKYKIENVVDYINDDFIMMADIVLIDERIDTNLKKEAVRKASKFNKKVFLIPDFFDISLHKSRLNQIDDMLLFEIENFSLNIEEIILKRFTDILVSFVSIIITSPLFLLSAILIKVYDKGPVFYKQERITEGRKKFVLYKFRSMIVNAEKNSGPTLAKNNDSRITPIGKFIRATRLDELPQLFNVLKGDMSLVGPRPEREFFVNDFIENIPNYEYRFNVKAGITGMAQVYGKYSTSAEEKLRYDLMYISEYSFMLDVEMIIKTLKVMLMKVSAKGD